MPRVRISEYCAKKIVYPYFGEKYEGIQIMSKDKKKVLKILSGIKRYVLKVDNGIKRRGKNGLLALNISKAEVEKNIKNFESNGFSQFLVEEYIPHKISDEKFIALERGRNETIVYYSRKGGVDIKADKNYIKIGELTKNSLEISRFLNLDEKYLKSLRQLFDKLYLSFLESNPFLVFKGKPRFLDLAVEVDSAASFFENAWDSSDFTKGKNKLTPEEIFVQQLNDQSPASLRLDVLNPDGSLFLLLSGGGASLVIADEIYNLGKGSEIANYAEYSGNPNEEETYLLTKNIISLMLKSHAKNKKLFIAGGVANFTDIRVTFKGVIRALDEFKDKLLKQGFKVYVRRGGPHQEEGLKQMMQFLERSKLLGIVAGPEMVLTEIVNASFK